MRTLVCVERKCLSMFRMPPEITCPHCYVCYTSPIAYCMERLRGHP